MAAHKSVITWGKGGTVTTGQEKTPHALHTDYFSTKTPKGGKCTENTLPPRAGIWSTANNQTAGTAPSSANKEAPMIFSGHWGFFLGQFGYSAK